MDCCEVGNDENSNTLSMHVNDSIILNPSSSSRKECRFVDLVDVDAMSEEFVLKKGYVFHSKIELKKAIYIFALEGKFQLKTVKSSRTRLVLRCKEDGCNLVVSVINSFRGWDVDHS